ncbi:putative amidase [Halenospora varia]|nr:putative amidase [Halenospora varia]
MGSVSTYQDIAAKAQAGVHNSIPAKWKLSPEVLNLKDNANVIEIPRTCGILTPAQLDITEQTATELVAKLATGDLSSVEVTEAFCARAAIAHQLTNCLISFFPDEGLKIAKALDEHLARTGKPIGPLHGLPVCIKDMYDLKGQRCTMGFVSWFDQIAENDSSMVKILRNAGAVFYSKTTMPQGGMMLETCSELWGVTVNPFNRKICAGGSSGGDGVLVAMKGSPVSPSSDIGGSIRAPAAFNGLYSIKPSSQRISAAGMRSAAPGNTSIKVSCGPVCHSVEDLKTFTKVINVHGTVAQYDPLIVPIPWREVQLPSRKQSFALWEFDGVVMPHPPILRALRESAQKLISAGHEVIPVKLPFDLWEVGLVTWKLYFQTGFKEGKALLEAAGEPMAPAMQFYLEEFKIKPLSIWELFECNVKQSGYKAKMAEWWTSTASLTSTGRPIDGLICPTNASAGFAHNFPTWWGYTSIWNILDYPSATMPVKGFKISGETDPNDTGYKPVHSNPFDKITYDMYDPELFAAQPVCLQIVSRPFLDEELVAMTGLIDQVVNGPK